MSEKAIVVKTKGSESIAYVFSAEEVTPASREELEAQISESVKNLDNIYTNPVNPLEALMSEELFPCSSCKKKGRVFMHPRGDFSTLKNGTRLVQCKVCRTEGSKGWTDSKREERRAYHREYAKRRKPPVYVSPEVREEIKRLTQEQDRKNAAKDSLFVAYSQDIQKD